MKPSIKTSGELEVVPRGEALGAEIRGVDLSRPLSESVRRLLREAWADHLVLLFRGQRLRDEEILRTCEIFGGVQLPAARAYQLQGGYQPGSIRMSEHPEIGIITNLDENGEPVADNGTLGSHEVHWHTDNSYVEVPPAGSFLYAIQIPDDGSGETSFSNQYLAYETLAEDLKTAVCGKYQVHDSSRNSAGKLRPTARLPESPEQVEGPAHPMVRVHPVTGKPALYLGRRRDWPSNYIVGLTNEESEALLDRLWAHATQPKFVWTHDWRVGDAVLWDNRCTMHYRTPVNPGLPRLMHRAIIKGEAVVPAA